MQDGATGATGATAVEVIVARFGLRPHPEGGFFRETYRAPDVIAQSALPGRFKGARAASTAILYLLEAGEFSAFHRIAADELWHFHVGDPLTVFVLGRDGVRHDVTLGTDFAAGQVPQAMVPQGAWFAAQTRVHERRVGYALVGCTVAPGFDFAEFELARRPNLSAEFPAESAIITALTRG